MNTLQLKYPGLKVKKKKYSDDSPANRLTAMIVDYINQCGGFASRITAGGTYRPELRRYVFSTQIRGVPDIVGVYDSIPIYVEVKIGEDSLSKYQLKVKELLEKAGARYHIAKNYNEFKQWFDAIMEETCWDSK